MQVKTTQESDTKAVLTVSLDTKELSAARDRAVAKLGQGVSVEGFRKGKAPAKLVEKSLDQSQLQSQVVEDSINDAYPQAVRESGIRPVAAPEISIKKYVPYTTLEFEAVVPVLGKLEIADYKKIKLTKEKASVVAKDVNDVMDNIRTSLAEKKDVDRAARDGDQVWIDFAGTDDKGQPVKGADGTNYPLALGSKTFIPGFEENLVGLKAGEKKTFTVTFPKDYGVAALRNKKVTFAVTVNKVQEQVKPELDDKLAAKVGPFKTLGELKADIKKQVVAEKEHQIRLKFESDLVGQIADKSTVAIPGSLVDEQVEMQLSRLKQDLVYRGQTLEEFLSGEGKTEGEYRKDVLRPEAENRLKASIILAEIAEREGLVVTPEELDARIEALREQYKSDARMQEELSKPENHQDIASRLLTEKTVAKLTAYATG